MAPLLLGGIIMAYSLSDIENKARELLGREPEQREDGLIHSAAMAVSRELESRLRPGVAICDIEELFTVAAGILTAAMLKEICGGTEGDLSSFSAGNLSVHFNGSSSVTPEKLRKCAEDMLAPYIYRGGFCFTGVAG